jgi:serine protease DegS
MKILNLVNALKFLLQFSIVGLALAFLLILIFPEKFLPESGNEQNKLQIVSPPTTSVQSYRDAISLAAPAVVNVYAVKFRTTQVNPLFLDPLFRRFFGNPPSEKKYDNNLGSGVILNDTGYVLTNAHVIKDADEIQVTLNDGRQTRAEIVGIDSETDLAVLLINLGNLPVAAIGNSDQLQVGDVVLAIGNPYNFGQTVTQGIVSATRRTRVGIALIEDFIQTDAAINPGNSGGALVNARGELVGINTANYSNTGGSQGIGFAIPIDLAIDVLQQLVKKGFVERGWLGIVPQPVPADIAETLQMKNYGIFVTAVFKDSPAALAKVMPGDIVTRVNGEELLDAQDAMRKISAFTPGEIITLDIIRGWNRCRSYSTPKNK